ncbi:NCS1 family nucleobase:cation symporter-1 [Scopulibacillus darangshiensis]|uniref:NCS1 family nucleobase:cation symporter-1 n=1 Tax=Scopulibacillus darangshiensis TaxID=442528 RepID=A0A4R2NT29_9BACL|nr:cytosine permease [Scopulibacillus darangshiensis]TCP24952.1 NCS1 family nucleobase:cation symporter-1 [Scopulibacillus darangshiensis]
MKIEKRSIDFVPKEERHGKPTHLFPVWFGANMHITTLVTGALVFSLGQNFIWSIVAIVIGNLIGAIFMASHSAQGPQLGIPQMIQSRAQYGVIGAIVPLIVAMCIYFGYLISSGLLGAQAFASAFSIGLTPSIILLNLLTFLVALFGHDVIHKMQKYFSWIFFIVFFVVTIMALRIPVPAGSWSAGGFDPTIFMLSVGITASWQLSFAPYVADYSRYLPIDTSPHKTFWYTYAGTVIGAAWMEIIGVIFALAVPHFLDHPGSNLAQIFSGPLVFMMYIIIVLGQLSINTFNLYGAFMSTTTVLEPFTKLKITPRVRGTFFFCITLIGTVITIWGQENFMAFFQNFLTFLGFSLIPWTSINLIDYYMLRRGEYVIKDIFDLNGRYGKVNWITIIAYVLSIGLQIPFINTSFYVGPVAKALDGADFAWVIGLVVPLIFYYFPMKYKIRTKENQNPVKADISNI